MNRNAVRHRAQHRCEYCRDPEQFSLATFHIEHIIAKQHGGDDDVENLALACPDCNLLKGPNIAANDPETGALTRLFHPRKDEWQEHFQAHNFTIEGITPIGRATARLLALNSPPRHRHRALLHELGV